MFHKLPLIGCFSRVVRDSGGAAALIFAIAMPVMLGFAGLGVEVGSWLWETRAMQGAADAAAVSAADALAFDSKGVPNAFRAEGIAVAGANGWKNLTNGVTVTVNNPPASGAYAGNTAAVEVIITQTATNWFSAFLPVGYTAPQLKARGVAMSNPAIDCMLSLSNANTAGINFALFLGNVTMTNCSIGDNAQGSNALEMTGVLTSVTAYSATVYGGINPGLFNSFNFTRAPAKNSGFITPDPYACPGVECRTMPTPTTPVAIASLGTIGTIGVAGTTAYPGSCSPGTTITTTMPLSAGKCYKGISVTAGTVTVTANAGAYTIISPTSPAAAAIKVTGGTLNITGGGNLTILGAPSEPAISVSGGTVSLAAGTNIIQGGTGQPAIAVTGGNVTIGDTADTILGGSGASGISATNGILTINTATNSIQGSQTGSGNPAITVAGATVTIGGTTDSILGGTGGAGILSNSGALNLNTPTNKIQGGPSNPAITVSGGTITIGGTTTSVLGGTGAGGAGINSSAAGALNLNATSNAIQGGTNSPAITATGGTVTIGGTTDTILGGTGGAGINLIGGAVNINAPTNTIQGGTGDPAIEIIGDTPVLTFAASNNNILAGAGGPAITILGTSGASPYARLVFGNGSNKIQGAAADSGKYSAMTIAGFGDVKFGDGSTTFGGPTVKANVPAVNDDAGFLASPTSHLGLTLGSGTYQFMEGLSVTGGNLTLNPSDTGIGYYIIDGGSNGGLNMTFGDLIGTNVTIVLTGSGADYANLNFNGADGATLTAPTVAGAWNTAGIAIFQDRNAPAGNTNTVYGINFDNITGAIYTPSQALQFEGLSVMTSQCMQLIASTITILGLAFINDQCEGIGVAPIGGNGAITLVE